MARPTKQGLDYFSLDTNIDTKLELFEAEHGLVGFGFIIKLFQKIYSNGYYYEWNEDEQLLFSKQINVDINQINVYINSAIKRNIFNKEIYEKYSILTSRGIQKRFLEACRRRKQIEMIEEITLIDFSNPNYQEFASKIVYVCNNLINVDINSKNDDNNSQSKVKESKVKEIKVVVEETEEEKTNRLYDLNVEKIQTLMIETLNTTNTSIIMECVEYLDKLPIELIEHALRKTARIEKPSWNYCRFILNDYVKANFKTLEEVRADELKHKSRNNKLETKEETAEEKRLRIEAEAKAIEERAAKMNDWY